MGFLSSLTPMTSALTSPAMGKMTDIVMKVPGHTDCTVHSL